MFDGHPMCAAGEHDFCRVIDGKATPALVVCSRCGHPIESQVLRRIIQEVQNKDPDSIHAFDRVHTRHNR